MRALALFLGGLLAIAFATGAQAQRPDDPGAPVKANRYQPMMQGTKSYRPVGPLPWGDVNRRVTPKKQGTPGSSH